MEHSAATWSGIVGLAGPAAGTKLVSDLLYVKYGFRTFSLAEDVREALLALDPMITAELSLAGLVERLGWEGAETHRVHGPEVRRALRAMGTDVGRAFFGEDVWTSRLAAGIASTGGFGPLAPVVVEGLLDDADARWVRDVGGSVWRVVDPAASSGDGPCSGAGLGDGLVDHVVTLGRHAAPADQVERFLSGELGLPGYLDRVLAELTGQERS